MLFVEGLNERPNSSTDISVALRFLLDKLKTIRDHLSAVSTDNIVVEAYKMSAFALMMHAIREIEDKEYEDYQGI